MAVVPVAAMAAVANFGEGESNDEESHGNGHANTNGNGTGNGDNKMNGSTPVSKIEPRGGKQKVENNNNNTKPDKVNSVVRLNVGGIEFVTTAGTLLWCGESSVLHRLANTYLDQSQGTGIPVQPLLDRDPDIFAHLLKYLRSVRFGTGTLPSDSHLRNALLVESRALRIPSLEADIEKIRLAEAVRRIVICEKHLIYVNGTAVSGHFSIAGRRNSAGWFGSFSEEQLTRSFQDRMSQLVVEKATPNRNNPGMKLESTVTASTVAHDGVAVEAGTEVIRLRHIHTVTLTFQASC